MKIVMGLRSCSKSELTLILLLTCGAISLTSTSEHQSDEPELILPSCPRTLSCKDRCSTVEEEENGTKSTAHCHCDPQCEKYRDCCADYRKFCINNQNISASFPSVHFKHMACVKTNTEKKISKYKSIQRSSTNNLDIEIINVSETFPVWQTDNKVCESFNCSKINRSKAFVNVQVNFKYYPKVSKLKHVKSIQV